MTADQFEEMTEEQLKAMLVAFQEMLTPIQEKIAAIQKKLEEREQEEREWDKFLNHPKSQLFLKKLTEETKADIAAGRIKEWSACREDLLHS